MKTNDYMQSGSPEVVVFSVSGNKRPNVEDSLLVAESLKLSLMSRRNASSVANIEVPIEFNGHCKDGNPAKGEHRHGYFLPLDADMDGFIDCILFYCPVGFSNEGRHRMRSLKNAKQWDVKLANLGKPADFGMVFPMFARSRTWISATPFLMEWSQMRLADQIARTTGLKSLPCPEFSVLEYGFYKGVKLDRFVKIRQDRKKQKIKDQPDRRGQFLKLEFPEKVCGPVMLGKWNHFGMGMFFSCSE